MRHRTRMLALAVSSFACWSGPAWAQPEPKPPRPTIYPNIPAGGVITVNQEYDDKNGQHIPKYQTVKITPSGPDGLLIAISDADQKALTGKFSSTATSTTVNVNAQYFDSNLQANVQATDYRSELAAAGLTSGSEVVVNNTSVEAYYFDASTGMFVTLSAFNVIAGQYGYDRPLDYPILFNNNDGTSTVDVTNMLYEYVEMNTYTRDLPAFTDGQAFAFTDGASDALPGVLLSTTPFTFDPTTGPVGTGFTGSAFVGAVSTVTAVPEPASMLLLALGAGAVATLRSAGGRRAGPDRQPPRAHSGWRER